MEFKGSAKRLDDIDLPRIAQRIGVGEDEIHAVLEVETSGGGFDSLGRPRILFEPHIFHRLLSGEKRKAAVADGLAYPKWGTRPYPRDSYPRLHAAMTIDEEAALKACSWGLGQIMGSNHKDAGFASVREMVTSFMADEENHLDAMVSFIIANKLDDELRAHNWAGFARGYNGPGYLKNKYDAKLAAAFAKWRKIADTPFPQGDVSEPVQEAPQVIWPVLRMGADGTFVYALQAQLVSIGYLLKIDGDFGPATRDAIKSFQKSKGLTPDGVVGPATRRVIDLVLQSQS